MMYMYVMKGASIRNDWNVKVGNMNFTAKQMLNT